MLNYNSSLIKENSYSELSMKAINPIMKFIIRGRKREFLSGVGKTLNMILPTEPCTSSSNNDTTAIWLSPDEWMVFSNNVVNKDINSYELENLLVNTISKANLGAITDVTDQYVLINIKGKKIFDLLSLGCPFNFNDFRNKKGSVIQSLIAKIDIIVHLKEIDNINLLVRRSYSEHLYSFLCDAASRI
ncbi:MAG: sarcosine oxidase subunit gamma [Alphaproteobacteria bacterium]|nr:sarcosine oxidase subunit gamma [Alphaproteobacteria bacterium]